MQLLGRWTRASQGHISLGAGCGCGGAVGGVQVQDLEINILDYLLGKYGPASAVAAMLRDTARHREGEAGSLGALLQAIARREVAAPIELQTSVLDDLNQTIDSFDQMHR